MLGNSPTSGDWTVTTEVERAYLKVLLPWADLNLGRQEINWGVGYAWSPTDVFGAAKTLDAGGLRRGVDAVVMRIPTAPLSYLSLVAAPDGDAVHGGVLDTWRYAARYHGNAGGTDWSLAAAQDPDTTMVGADAKGDLVVGELSIGWHAEVAHHTPRDAGSGPWVEGLLGADYSWNGGKVIWAGEYFYDSRGAATQDAYDYVSWLAGDRQHLARHYAFTQLAYAHDEFTSISGSVLANLVDRSAVATAGATVLLSDGCSLSLSATALSGSQGDEFSGRPHPGAPPGRPDLMLRALATYSF
jgi:hypothetical protein